MANVSPDKKQAEKRLRKLFPMKIVRLSELKPYENNPRTISRKMFEKLCKSITEEGFVQPLVIDENNRVIGGHQRMRAAKKCGLKEVPCRVVDLKGDEKKAKRLNLRLNKISGEFDYDKLFGFLDGVDKDLLDDVGFDKDEIEEILTVFTEANSEIEDRANESAIKKSISFEATVASDLVNVKIGSFKAKLPVKDYDRFNKLFEWLLAKKKISNEREFVAWMIKTSYRAAKG